MQELHANVAPTVVTPAELTELVARLQSQHPADVTTTQDIASTLGISEAEVLAVLAKLRGEVKSTPSPLTVETAPKPTQGRRRVWLPFKIGISVAALVAAYNIGVHVEESSHRRVWRSYPTEASELHHLIPQGLAMKVGELSYSGTASRPLLQEEELAQQLSRVVARAQGPVPGGRFDVKAIRRQLASSVPTGAEGVTFVPFLITKGARVLYKTYILVASSDVSQTSRVLDREITDGATARLQIVANRLRSYFPKSSGF